MMPPLLAVLVWQKLKFPLGIMLFLSGEQNLAVNHESHHVVTKEKDLLGI